MIDKNSLELLVVEWLETQLPLIKNGSVNFGDIKTRLQETDTLISQLARIEEAKKEGEGIADVFFNFIGGDKAAELKAKALESSMQMLAINNGGKMTEPEIIEAEEAGKEVEVIVEGENQKEGEIESPKAEEVLKDGHE